MRLGSAGNKNHYDRNGRQIGANQLNKIQITQPKAQAIYTEISIKEKNQAEYEDEKFQQSLTNKTVSCEEAIALNGSNIFPSSKASDKRREKDTGGILNKSNTRYSNNIILSQQAQGQIYKEANLQSEPSLNLDIETPQLKDSQNTQLNQAKMQPATALKKLEKSALKSSALNQTLRNKQLPLRKEVARRKQKQLRSQPLNGDLNYQQELIANKKSSNKKFKINENILVPYSIRKKLNKSEQKSNKSSHNKKFEPVTQFIDSNSYKIPFSKIKTLNEQSITIIDEIYNTPNSQKSQKCKAHHTVFLHSAPQKSVQKAQNKHSPYTKRTPMTVVDMMIEQMNEKQLSKQKIQHKSALGQSLNSGNRFKDVEKPIKPPQRLIGKLQDQNSVSYVPQSDKRNIKRQISRRIQNSASSGKQSKTRQKNVNSKMVKKGASGGSTQGSQGQQIRSSPKVFYRTSSDRQNQKQYRPHMQAKINSFSSKTQKIRVSKSWKELPSSFIIKLESIEGQSYSNAQILSKINSIIQNGVLI